VFGDVTTGAENDLVEATRLARHMVTSWGMSTLGLVAYQESSQNRFLGYELGREHLLSEQRAAQIDQEIHRLIEGRHQSVTTLLTRERGKLDQLAAYLLEQEIADHKTIIELLGPRPRLIGYKSGTGHGQGEGSRIIAYQERDRILNSTSMGRCKGRTDTAVNTGQ
jgi:cell division protease FtsH